MGKKNSYLFCNPESGNNVCLLVCWGRDLEGLEEPAGFLSLVKAQTGEADGASLPPAFDHKPSHKAQIFMVKPPYILKQKNKKKKEKKAIKYKESIGHVLQMGNISFI